MTAPSPDIMKVSSLAFRAAESVRAGTESPGILRKRKNAVYGRL